MFLISDAVAQESAPAVVGQAAGAPQGDPLMFNIMLIAGLFILFYFLMIRPQSKRLKEQKEMLDSLKKGDTVVTSGGVIGKVSQLIDEKEIEIEVAKGVNIRVLRYMIQQRTEISKANDNTNNKPAAKKADSSKKASPKKAAVKKTPAKKAPVKKSAAKK